MKEIIIKDKEKYFIDHYPFTDRPKLTDKKLCIHCEKIIVVGEYKVFIDKQKDEFICCPNAPDCDGTVIDWFDV